MIEKINVNISSMQEMEDAVRAHRRSVALAEEGIDECTGDLFYALGKCSRYKQVKERAHKACLLLGEYRARLENIADDIEERAEFLKEFERISFKF